MTAFPPRRPPAALGAGIRLSHFDSPCALNCGMNPDAALSFPTYCSPGSVLRVLCPTNRLLCPPPSTGTHTHVHTRTHTHKSVRTHSQTAPNPRSLSLLHSFTFTKKGQLLKKKDRRAERAVHKQRRARSPRCFD